MSLRKLPKMFTLSDTQQFSMAPFIHIIRSSLNVIAGIINLQYLLVTEKLLNTRHDKHFFMFCVLFVHFWLRCCDVAMKCNNNNFNGMFIVFDNSENRR